VVLAVNELLLYTVWYALAARSLYADRGLAVVGR
jgi:hypothetical protein